MIRLIATLILMLTVSRPVYAAPPPFDPFEADIEANMANPAVPQKHAASVVSAMNHLMRTLRRAGFDARTVRSGQVVTVTIPASSLFMPNAGTLKPEGMSLLRTLSPYVKRTDNYKTVIAVHSDDTGDVQYSESLTAERSDAVCDFFLNAIGNDDAAIIPYGLGNDEPVAPNTGYANRAKNRRVEISFVPTAEYIDRLRKK